ncbi:DNA topoisomerase IV [Flavobacterium tibetense]|uniref:DNA topoisomerase IV n=1 Tax=Flavobacterium tibetense TaxID=2233533 RepID=A0A365P2V8_9FLAO|nr:DNA topoisomerase IV [Flavobacterium tibetense]RBA28872.1 DNA topoisomerase IV [Flavobacterium tibetense]
MKINLQHTFYIILTTLLLTSCYNQERNCKDYKTGKFSFDLEIDEKLETSIFERNDSLQIETFRGKTDSSSVRWVNDCEFILQNIKPKNREEKKGIHIKILTTTADSYTFEYSFVGDLNKQKGIAKRVQ